MTGPVRRGVKRVAVIVGIGVSAVLLCLLGTAFALLDGLFEDDAATYEALGCGTDGPIDPSGPR